MTESGSSVTWYYLHTLEWSFLDVLTWDHLVGSFVDGFDESYAVQVFSVFKAFFYGFEAWSCGHVKDW